MGRSIMLRRRGNFNGDFGHILKGKTHLFSVIKNQNETYDLLRRNRIALVRGISKVKLDDMIAKFNARFEINEGDIDLR
jgi:hypothetical protein